jgi:chromosome segregation protein
LNDIGPVNLLAMEEFEEAKVRLSFIEEQYGDLVSARDNLNSLIKELDSEAKQKFLQTVAEVNENFSRLFGALFEGGEARIEMSEGDPLEAGIEIIAKPSGKKWINMSLMSGGEKALTAISLLFALIKKNPSPFCFMDEVDAALDEINTLRFTKLLREFSKNTQIVIITHSKRTMASANLLYGVTNEEPGISKIISMKLVKVAD